jgi:inner membrane protein
MYYTHLAFGLLVALLGLSIFDIKYPPLFILVILLFSVFPDIDETKSKIGKKNKLLSGIINFIFGHRGLIHTIYIPLILFIIFYTLSKEIGIAILFGYGSHLIIDSINKAGIIPLYPISSKKIRGFVKTGSFLEKIIFLVIIFVDLYLLLNYI